MVGVAVNVIALPLHADVDEAELVTEGTTLGRTVTFTAVRAPSHEVASLLWRCKVPRQSQYICFRNCFDNSITYKNLMVVAVDTPR